MDAAHSGDGRAACLGGEEGAGTGSTVEEVGKRAPAPDLHEGGHAEEGAGGAPADEEEARRERKSAGWGRESVCGVGRARGGKWSR